MRGLGLLISRLYYHYTAAEQGCSSKKGAALEGHQHEKNTEPQKKHQPRKRKLLLIRYLQSCSRNKVDSKLRGAPFPFFYPPLLFYRYRPWSFPLFPRPFTSHTLITPSRPFEGAHPLHPSLGSAPAAFDVLHTHLS